MVCASKAFSITTSVEHIDGIKVIRCSSFGSLLSMPITFSLFYRLFGLLRLNDMVIFHEPFPLTSLLCSLYGLQGCKGVIFWHSEIVRQKFWLKIFYSFYCRLIKQVDAVIYTYPEQLERSIYNKQFSTKKTFHVPLGVPEVKGEAFGTKPSFVTHPKKPFFVFF